MLHLIRAVMGHDTSSSLDIEGKRGKVKKKILGLLKGVPERMAAYTATPQATAT